MQQIKPISRLTYWVTEYPWWTLFTTLLICTLLSLGCKNLTIKNDYRIFFGKDNPQLLAFERMQDTYTKNDNVMLIVEPETGDVFNQRVLSAIKDITTASWQLPFANRVDSITNYQHTVAQDDDLTVADLVSDPSLVDTEQMQSIRQVALSEPMLVNRLISTTGHVSGINVIFQLPQKGPMEPLFVAEKVRELAAKIEEKYPDITLHLTGMIMMNNAFGESAINDNTTLIPIMYLVVILVLLVSFRSFSATFSVVILIVLSILSAMGIVGWLGWYLTSTSAIAPTIILTMAVADCVHLLVTMLHNMRIGHEKRQAIRESLRINFQPIFLTSITTALGFLSMNFSDSPPFRDLGNIVAIGVMIAFVLSITLLPALMSILPVRVRKQDDFDNSLMNHLANFVIRRRKWLLIGNGLLAIVLISFAPQNELNDEFVKYFDDTIEFRRATDFMIENMGGIYTIEFSIQAQSSGGINEPEYLVNVDRFTGWLYQQPEVVHVNTLTDTFKRLNKNMHGDDQDWYRLPERRDLAAQYLLLYEMSLPYGLDLNNQINLDKSAIRLIATMKDMSSNDMLALEQRINTWLQANMPELKVEPTSPALMFSHIGKRNIIRMIAGTLTALVLISLLLIFAFKSLKLGLLSLIPNLIPAGIAFGIWSFVAGQIGLSLSVVTGMTLGIVVDDTVHFISKYRRARIEKSMTSQEAVHYAFSTVGVALWITSLVLVSGFSVLCFSHFTMNSAMGLMSAITITIALFMDLLFLPPLLMSMDKK